MDSSIMKLLEEDDDETLHYGADLEALQAALNRDIAGDAFSSPPPHSCNGLEFHKHGVNTASENSGKQHQPYLQKTELKPNVALPGLKSDGIPNRANHLHQRSQENILYEKGPENSVHIPQENGVTACKKDSIRVNGRDGKPTSDPGPESQYLILQKMSNQDTTVSRKQTNQAKSSKQVAFAELLPFIVPLLDKDRALQLTTLYEKLKKNDYPRDLFVKNMRGIVGDQILKLAVARLNDQSINQQREGSVQTPTPQNLSVKKEAVDVTACNGSHTTKVIPQKRKIVDTHSGPASSFKMHPATERSFGSTTELHSQASHTSSALADERIPYKLQSNGLKNQVETLDSSTLAGSKKQRVSAACDGQSIAELIDVTSTVNLREEEEQLFSTSKEHIAVSEASRKTVQAEEQKLILQKAPLHKKLAQIMAKCGVMNLSKDVERCISLGVEERIRGLLCNLIRFSKQRVDVEKERHEIVITSDIHKHLMILNRRAKDLWIQKQAADAQKRTSEESTSGGADGEKEKEEGRGKSVKAAAVNKEEDEKMRATAANAAARVAVGGDDHLSRWQLMAEQARKKRQSGEGGGFEMVGTCGREDDDLHNNNSTLAKNNQGSHISASGGGGKKKGGGGGVVQQRQRSIGVRDVIGVLERETQMNKSTLLYKLYT